MSTRNKRLRLVRDINGYNTFLLPYPFYKYQGLLTVDAEQTFTVPAQTDATYPHWGVIFSFQPGSTVWVAYNQTAERPAGAIASTTSELNPTGRELTPGDVIHFITGDTAVEFGMILYAIQQQ